MTETLLGVHDLTVRIPTARGLITVVDGISFDVGRGEVLAVVGESGCGKTTMAHALLGLVPGAMVTGCVELGGRNILKLPAEDLRAIRGSQISVIFQDALAALNPLHRIGDQVAEAVRVHHPRLSRRAARARSVELLGIVGIADPAARARQYPHQLSGGMRQRVAIAMAVANDPDVLVADEATTALDSTTQAQILELLERTRARTGSAMLLITHDLGVVAANAHRVLVMYAGRAAELGAVADVLRTPSHPYTRGLLGALPRRGEHQRRLARIVGTPPLPGAAPPGCSFHPRCPFAHLPDPCASARPPLQGVRGTAQMSACHLAERVVEAAASGPET